MTRELRSIQVTTKITPTMLRMLDLMVARGGHKTRGALLNKIIRDVLDDNQFWFARKLLDNELSDWKPMRCVHEVRAYLVSKR